MLRKLSSATLFIALLAFTYAYAADNTTKPTAEEFDIFDIESKDLDSAPTKDEDFPMPDFSTFEDADDDDSFTDDLFVDAVEKNDDNTSPPSTTPLQETNPDDAKETETTDFGNTLMENDETKPTAQSVDSAAEQDLDTQMDSFLSTTKKDTTDLKTPEPKIADEMDKMMSDDLLSEDWGSDLDKPTESVSNEPQADTKTEGSKQTPSTSDTEEYKKLKRHLANFIRSFGGQYLIADEDTDNTTTPEEPRTTNITVPEGVDNDMQISEANAAAPADNDNDFDNFLGIDEAETNGSIPDEELDQPIVKAESELPTIDKKEQETPVKTEDETLAKVLKKEEAEPSTPPSSSAPLPKKKIAQPLKQAKPELNASDKAYFKLLDEKRTKLPKHKQLSESVLNTIENVTASIAPPKKEQWRASDTQHFKIKHEDDLIPSSQVDGTRVSNTGINISMHETAAKESVIKRKMDDAYKALLVGQISASVSIYKEVLDADHENKGALFGLATAYHRNSQFEQARAIYAEILEMEPNNKEVLNNFLVLVAEESPESALIELQKLERLNSDFSPIPAQIAMIHLKMDRPQKAERYLRRAVILSPANITYKYNLAITSDKLDKQYQAIHLYKQIIEAVKRGAIIPGSINNVMDRLTFLEGKVASEQ